jgi:hypothetical protein
MEANKKREKSSPATVTYVKEKKLTAVIAYRVFNNHQVQYGATIFRPSDGVPVMNRQMRKAHRHTALRHLEFYPVVVDLPPDLVKMSNRIQTLVNSSERTDVERREFRETGAAFQQGVVRFIRRCMTTMGRCVTTRERRVVRRREEPRLFDEEKPATAPAKLPMPERRVAARTPPQKTVHPAATPVMA